MIWKSLKFSIIRLKNLILSIFHFDTFVLIKTIVYCVTNMVERMTNLQMET